MAGSSPQSKHNELTDRINQFVAARSKTGLLNEVAWQNLKRDIQAFGTTPKFMPTALLYEAILWGIRGREDEMDRCFKSYANKFGQDWPWHRARAMRGPSLGRLDMVTDMLEFGYPKGSVSDLGTVASVCNQAGLFVTCLETLKKFSAMRGDTIPVDEAKFYGHIPEAVSYMQLNCVDELELAKRLAVATKVVRARHGELTAFEVYSSEAGISYDYCVSADIDDLVDTGLAISEALLSSFDDTMSLHMSIGVSSSQGDDYGR